MYIKASQYRLQYITSAELCIVCWLQGVWGANWTQGACKDGRMNGEASKCHRGTGETDTDREQRQRGLDWAYQAVWWYWTRCRYWTQVRHAHICAFLPAWWCGVWLIEKVCVSVCKWVPVHSNVHIPTCAHAGYIDIIFFYCTHLPVSLPGTRKRAL